MPEGPEIRRAADALAAAVVGAPLDSVSFEPAALKRYERRLRGHRIESISPRGKALLTRFDNGLTLYTHNQLYGVWRIAAAGTRPKTSRVLRVALETADRAILLYSATDVSIWPSARIEAHPFLQRIGPDVLDPAFDVAGAAARLALPRFGRRGLGALLLDQSFLAGLGNYLRAEILWQAALLPERRPIDLDGDEQARLSRALVELPASSYRTRAHRGAARLQDTPFRFKVYERAGLACARCGDRVLRETNAARPLYLCRGCQH